MAEFPSQYFPVLPSSWNLWPLPMSGHCHVLVRQDNCAVSCSWDVTFLEQFLMSPGARHFLGFFATVCQSCCEHRELGHGMQTQRMRKLERLFLQRGVEERRECASGGDRWHPSTGLRQSECPPQCPAGVGLSVQFLV